MFIEDRSLDPLYWDNAMGTRGSMNLRVLYLGGGDKRAQRRTSAAGAPGKEWTWKWSLKHAKHGEYHRSTWLLSLRVLYLGGGNTGAKRSTSAAGALSTEWTWCAVENTQNMENATGV